MKKALSVCTCLCTFSVWEIQFHVFCEPQMLDGEHCNLVSIFSPWLEGNLIIFNHLPKAHLGQHLKRTLATFCCSRAFINTVNFQHFFQVQDAPFKNHISFFVCFFLQCCQMDWRSQAFKGCFHPWNLHWFLSIPLMILWVIDGEKLICTPKNFSLKSCTLWPESFL